MTFVTNIVTLLKKKKRQGLCDHLYSHKATDIGFHYPPFVSLSKSRISLPFILTGINAWPRDPGITGAIYLGLRVSVFYKLSFGPPELPLLLQ